MLEKIKQIYKDALVSNYHSVENPDKYEWFLDQSQQLIGIEKEQLTENEINLLLLNLTKLPNYLNKKDLSERELLWYKILHQNYESSDLTILANRNYRFIFFHLDTHELEHANFREALQGIFSGELSIIWTKSTEGVMVEEDPSEFSDLDSKQQIINTLTSDFYVNISMYIAPLHQNIEDFINSYSWEHSCFLAARKHLKADRVYSFENILPYLYIENMKTAELKKIIDTLLPYVQEDQELLQTIRTYIESNLNITYAAKKLYVHRNTLQYRIDKFIEKTGVDIKQMKGAFSVYIGLLSLGFMKHLD